MKKAINLGVDPHIASLIKSLAKALNITQVRLVSEAVVAAARVHDSGSRNANSQWRALRRRYDDATPVTVWIEEDQDGKPAPRILVDGVDDDDVAVMVVPEPDRGVAHFFVEVDDATDEIGTVRVGEAVLLVRPLRAAGRLPWPADPSAKLVVRLGDLAKPGPVGELVRS